MQPGGGWPARALDEFGPPPDRPSPAAPGLKLREIAQMLMRRKRLILLTLLVLNTASILVVHSIKPRYTAEATLIIGAPHAQVVDLKGVLAGLTGESDVIESETQVLRSRRIARSVVQQLHLDQDPEFNPALRPPSVLSRLAAGGRAWWNAAWSTLAARIPPSLRGFERNDAAAVDGFAGAMPAGEVRMHDPLAEVVDNFLRRLGIAPKGHSRVLAVSFDSGNPVLSSQVANAVADTYISDQLKAKLDATAQAHKWLNERVAELREQVISADQAVEAYRQRAGITPGKNGTLLTEQVSTLGEQVMEARVARATAEARLQAVQGALSSQHGLDSVPEVMGSLTVQALRAQESTLLAQAAEASRTYGDQHPRAAALRAEVGAVEGRIHAEVGKVAAGLQDEVRAARAREATLSSNLGSLRNDVSTASASEVELRALEHEADADRALYDRLLARARETNVEAGLQQPDAQIISYADAPEAPSFPNPAMILPVFFLASCIGAALLVFGVENLDHGFSNLEQVEQTLGIAALGVVPRLKRGMGNRHTPGTYILEHPASAYGEAIRSLHTSLMLSDVDKPPKVVLVASALPGEGKSSIVLSLARLMASCGKRVVVLDCDLRRPDLHREFGTAQSPGLTDLLSDKVSVFDALRLDTQSPAYLVPAGSRAQTSPDLFASENMRKLVATLAERFDLVLLDSAPVLAVSDTRNLCRLADKTVFLVRWQDTRRFAAMPALRQIVEAGGNLAGVLLSMVDLDQYAKYAPTSFYQRRVNFYLEE